MCSIKEKIKKLLKLSESPNEFEAAKAIMKAQELACKNNISIDNINVDESDDFVVDSSIDTGKKTVSSEEKAIAAIIASNFKVEIYLSRRYGKSTINIIGMEQDVDVFKTVYTYALLNFKRFRKEFLKEYKKTNPYYHATSVKNSYLFGFIKGLDDKFKENVIEHALVVVTPALVEQKLRSMGLRKGRRSRVKVTRDSAVKSQGYSDGRKSAM